MSAFDSSTTQTDENGQSRSGVFPRIMARDLYDLTRRVEVLERHSGNPFSARSTAWLYTAPVLIFVMLLVSSIIYFGHRVDIVENLQREETLALRNELESKQLVIDELRQTIRQQARSLRTIAKAPALATKESTTIAPGKSDLVPKRAPAPQRPGRATLPPSLEPGQVLLIVASTVTKEDAIVQAQKIELDGHASEVVLGMTGYYGVALGRFDFDQAKSMRLSMVETGVVNMTPYLMTDESIDSYVYP